LSRLFSRGRNRIEEAPRPPAPPPPSQPQEPPPDALAVKQMLWGPGYTIPGKPKEVLALVKPFGLTPAMSMLDIAAGLGGPARTVADAFHTYVTGLERDAEMARRGLEMSVALGVAKRVPINLADPESFELGSTHYDCVLGREALHGVRDKERWLRVLIQGMKPRGGFLVTEFLRDRTAGERPELGRWAQLQAQPPQLWTLERLIDCLKSLGLDVRVTDDMSDAYRSTVVAAWAALIETMDLRKLPRSHLAAVLKEAERSIVTLRALQSGALRMFRIYALARRAAS
jgi:SAM-dependent methyltransferase